MRLTESFINHRLFVRLIQVIQVRKAHNIKHCSTVWIIDEPGKNRASVRQVGRLYWQLQFVLFFTHISFFFRSLPLVTKFDERNKCSAAQFVMFGFLSSPEKNYSLWHINSAQYSIKFSFPSSSFLDE